MNPVIALLVVSCLTAGILGSAILARDPSQRTNQLLAAMLFCSAYWSLFDILWSSSNDPATVLWLLKLSAIGWIPLGPLALHLFLEITGKAGRRHRRTIAFAYSTAALAILGYVATPWFIHTPIRVWWGWSYTFGPLFLLAFVPTMVYVCAALVMWPRLAAQKISPGERRQVLLMFAGMAVPATVSTVTDVLLPYNGIHVPRLGSTSILAIGIVVSISVRRYGYFLLAPGAFTQEILETLRDGVALLRVDRCVRSCNEALAQLVGTSQESVCEWPISEFLPRLVIDPSREFLDHETVLESTRDGSIPVSVSSSPLRDDKGAVIGCVIAVRDLREVAALRNRLVTSGRLAAVGELAAGIAHEINNPVTYVRANLMYLEQGWKQLERAVDPFDRSDDLAARFHEGREILHESVEGVDRITSIVRDVGAIAHAGVDNTELVDINELVDNAVNVAALSHSVTIERCYADLPKVRCASQQIKQVLLNLLINAFQAIDTGGRIRLVTDRSGDEVEIRVEDDGCGIPAGDLERIFDPFFTTRPVGEGTGLGLALCYQIVRSHGGEIRVESQPGVGTSFRVLLPADDDGS